jgi:hypothetical protein
MLEDMEELSPEDIIERNQLYLSERNERKIYMDKALHITFLQLIFSLLLTPMYEMPFSPLRRLSANPRTLSSYHLRRGTLQPLYTDQFPVNNKKLNIPFLLHSRTWPRPRCPQAEARLFVVSRHYTRDATDINHPANGPIIPELVERSLEMKASAPSLLAHTH